MKKLLTISFAVVCAVLAAAMPALADTTDLDAFLDTLDNTRQDLVDFTANFRQAKFASLFEETTLSSGSFLFRAPGDILLHTAEPDESYMVIRPDEVRFYFPLLEQVEVYPVDDQESLSSLLAVLQEESKLLRERYALSYLAPGTAKVELGDEEVAFPKAKGLELVPNDEGLRRYFVRLDFWLKPESNIPCLVVIEESTGDKTTIVFGDLKSNVGLTDKDFELDVPEGTEIIRPDTSTDTE